MGSPHDDTLYYAQEERRRKQRDRAVTAAALVTLAQWGIPPDIQELLVRGDPNRGIPPHALAAALSAGKSPEIRARKQLQHPTAAGAEVMDHERETPAVKPIGHQGVVDNLLGKLRRQAVYWSRGGRESRVVADDFLAAADVIEQMSEALKPFAAFAEKAEAFVTARAKDGGSPIMPPSSDFRLAEFQRARAALTAQAEEQPQVSRDPILPSPAAPKQPGAT